MTFTISNSISRNCFQLMRDCKLENFLHCKLVRKFSSFSSEWRKRTIPLEETTISDRIFRTKWNSHFLENTVGNCRIPPEVVLSFPSERKDGNFLNICQIDIFQSFISRKREIDLQMVSRLCRSFWARPSHFSKISGHSILSNGKLWPTWPRYDNYRNWNQWLISISILQQHNLQIPSLQCSCYRCFRVKLFVLHLSPD